jgi:hypothetical protein
MVEIMEVTPAPASTSERLPAGYAPRNALNADEIRKCIAARSDARDDTSEIRAWLLNHFLRHAIANFEPARRIESIVDARAALGSKPLPDWAATRIKEAASGHHTVELVWVDPDGPPLLELEARLLEFLNSRSGTPLEGKLARINCPQAIAMADAEHAKLSERIARGWRHSRPEALRNVVDVATGTFVELLPHSASLREEMAYESYIMRHCLGQFSNRRQLTGGYGEHYANSVSSGKMRVFSLRDRKGEPRITISAHVRPDLSLALEQVKGKQNRPPVARYFDDLLVCLDALATNEETPADCIRIGVVRTADGWRRMEHVTDPWTQVLLVSRYPQLYAQLATPTPLVDWLIAGRQRDLLSQERLASGALRYALSQGLEENGVSRESEVPRCWRFVTEDVTWPHMPVKDARQAIASASRWRHFFARVLNRQTTPSGEKP